MSRGFFDLWNTFISFQVCLLLMPLEIGWASTVSWQAGDAMCRIMAFFRIFGLYLSSFVLVCISIDRYFAVLKPLSLQYVARRSTFLLTAAWAASTICSMPQVGFNPALIILIENNIANIYKTVDCAEFFNWSFFCFDPWHFASSDIIIYFINKLNQNHDVDKKKKKNCIRCGIIFANYNRTLIYVVASACSYFLIFSFYTDLNFYYSVAKWWT